MKKAITIMSVVIIVLMIAQLALMFLPYFHMTFIKSVSNKNPQPADYSLVDLTWVHTEQMCKVFKADNKDFAVNINVVDWVLVFIFSCITVVIHFVKFANDKSKYETTSAAVCRFVTHVGPFVVAYYCYHAIATSQILHLGNAWIANTSMILLGASAALAAVRYVLAFLLKHPIKKKVAA